jgi:uncharacterized repeat protein (TIGR02543 family)
MIKLSRDYTSNEVDDTFFNQNKTGYTMALGIKIHRPSSMVHRPFSQELMMQTAYPSVRPFWFRLALVIILALSGLFWLLLLSQAAYGQSQTVTTTLWYVKADAAGSNDGSSWADAFTDLQEALAAAQPNDEIWVAAGLYKPTADDTDREATFHLLDGVAIYGGFAGDETDREERDWESNITVLSGDIDDNDLTDPHGVVTDTANIVGGNSYHVVTGSGVTNTAVLDGFTITAGLADDDDFPHNSGAGLYNEPQGSPSLTNLTFIANRATVFGGALMNATGSRPSLSNMYFINNMAEFGGGAVYNGYSSSPILSNTHFEGNSSPIGGGMFNYNDSSPLLQNASFSYNSGSGMVNDGSNPVLNDVIFSNNTWTWGGGMHNSGGSSPILTNVSFVQNNSDNNGGGMFNDSYSNPLLTGVSFNGNVAGMDGGGLYSGLNTSPVLHEVTFVNNVANGPGGGLQQSGGSLTLVDVSFSGNSSTNGPGGGLATFGVALSLTNGFFWGNSANSVDGFGGGLAIWNSGPTTLVNVSFSGNIAYMGAGLYNFNSSPTLTNLSFGGNRAFGSGGGLANNGSNPVIQNSIFWGNQDSSGVGTAVSAISNTNSTPTISYSLVQGSNGSGDDWNEDLGIDLGNNLDADPLFIDPPDPAAAPTDEGNLRLLPDSPAIDAGNNVYVAGIETDLDGNARIVGPHVDLGPYEVQPVTYTITHQVVGDGSILLEPEQTNYVSGEVVTVTAVATPGWSFVGWEGDLTGDTNPAELVMDGDKTITATFSQDSYGLMVHVVGDGSVELEPDQTGYVYGDVVTVTAVATPGWSFVGWEGDLTGDTNPAELVMDGDKTITATFSQDSYGLTVHVMGEGSVELEPDQAGYLYGEVVTVTAVATPGWSFVGWEGDLTGDTNPAELVMDGDKIITATFSQDSYGLTVHVIGDGSIELEPEQAGYVYGDVVTVTAVATPGWTFTGWEGDLTGDTNPAELVMDGDKVITAVFVQDNYTLYLPFIMRP